MLKERCLHKLKASTVVEIIQFIRNCIVEIWSLIFALFIVFSFVAVTTSTSPMSVHLWLKQLPIIVLKKTSFAEYRATKVISRCVHYKGRANHHYGAIPPAVVSLTPAANSPAKSKSSIMETQAEGLLGIAHLPVETLQQQESDSEAAILGEHSSDDSSIYSTERIPEDSILALEMEEDRTLLLDSDEHYYLSDTSNKTYTTSCCDAMLVD